MEKKIAKEVSRRLACPGRSFLHLMFYGHIWHSLGLSTWLLLAYIVVAFAIDVCNAHTIEEADEAEAEARKKALALKIRLCERDRKKKASSQPE